MHIPHNSKQLRKYAKIYTPKKFICLQYYVYVVHIQLKVVSNRFSCPQIVKKIFWGAYPGPTKVGCGPPVFIYPRFTSGTSYGFAWFEYQSDIVCRKQCRIQLGYICQTKCYFFYKIFPGHPNFISQISGSGLGTRLTKSTILLLFSGSNIALQVIPYLLDQTPRLLFISPRNFVRLLFESGY